jgi:hypothetical protein
MAWGLSLATSQSTNPAANSSTVSGTLFLTWSNANRYSGFTTSGNINIGGNNLPFTGPTSGGSTAQNGSQVLASHSVPFGHNTNTGTRGAVGTSANFDASGTNTIAPQNLSTTGTTFGALDYDRSPTTPTLGTITRNSTGTQITTFNFSVGVNNNGTAVTSTYQYSSSPTFASVTGSSTTLPLNLASATTGYYFRISSTNGDGTKVSAISTIRPGVPTAPAALNYVKTGRNVTLTATASSSAGGGTISSYSVQFRTSSDGGTSWGSWGNTQTMTDLSYTYVLLEPALTYDFRVFSTNETGNSLTTSVAAPFFVAAGGKRWNGTAFVPTQTAKRWSGTAWVDLTTAKRWNGTAWVDLS